MGNSSIGDKIIIIPIQKSCVMRNREIGFAIYRYNAVISLQFTQRGKERFAAGRTGEAGSLIVRLWNPCCEAAEDTLEVGFALQKADRISLDERRTEPLSVKKNSVLISIGPWELVTLRLKKEGGIHD